MKPFEYAIGLNEEGKKHFDDIRKKFGLSEPHHLILVSFLAHSLQTIRASQRIIDEQGIIIETLHGSKAHPLHRVVNDSMNQARAISKQLKLEDLVNEADDISKDFGRW